MVFTAEPGVYSLDNFGLRTEDVVLVQEGEGVDILSGRRAGGPWNP